MTSNPIEAAMHRVLNDRRIFWMPQELIDRANWSEFREALWRDDKSRAAAVLESAEKMLTTRINNERDNTRRSHLEDAKALLIGLKTYVNEGSVLVRDLAQRLDTFGPLRPNLPNMEDFGKVIEGHSRPTAEQFFLYKIQKEKHNRRRDALAALFEVVKGLYGQRVDPLEIAFFVRKVESLTQIVEVLRWQASRP
ncbi:MAG: hypothetical protein ACE5JQ_03875 [Candidatus Methylomirabilales bacterium]